MMKENSINVLNYAKTHEGENFTVADMADALGLTARSVNGTVTALANHKDADGNKVPLLERVPAEMTLGDGTVKAIKLIRVTDAGKTFSPAAED